jgi:hypothetical protein
LLSLIGLLNLGLYAQFEPSLRFFVAWTLAILILLPPYVLLGVAISLALTRGSYRVALVYGVDLVGASAGCLVTLALLTMTDPYTAILLVGAIGALAALAFAMAAATSGAKADVAPRLDPTPRRAMLPRFLLRPGVALGALLLLSGANQLLGTHGLRPFLLKAPFEAFFPPIEERWNSFSRITLGAIPFMREPMLWSASAVTPRMEIDQRILTIDAGAGTPMYRYGGDPHELQFLRFDLTTLAYSIRHQGRAAVIGIGGGRDLLTASVFGFDDITAVEYNPIFVKLFMSDYRDYSGSGYIRGLRVFVDEARSWFARNQEQFDLIQMSMIDTWAATGAGAFTLSENGLYTVNGWKRFLSRLRPGGLFTVSRWYSPDHLDETARVLSLAMATLIELGVEDPSAHIYLVGNRNLSTLIVCRDPLSSTDVATLDETVRALQFRILAAPHRAAADPVFDRILRAKTTGELVRIGRAAPINLTPTWDSSPFFFNQLRLSDFASLPRALDIGTGGGVIHGNLVASFTLLTLVLLSTIVVLIVIIGPARSSARSANAAALLWSSAYFLAIGIAFMFVEISLVQRMSVFLGHPIYGLAIVLFGIILATGLGSLLCDRLMPPSRAALVGWPLALAAYLGTLPLWIGGVLENAETGSLPERSFVCLLTMVPAGIVMGFMFPSGMRLCARIDTRTTPWLWAVNGAAGVLASGAAVLVSIETSLNVSLWVGAAAYATVAGVGLQLQRLGSPRDRAPAKGTYEPLADGVN